jgi:hypothetical protein
VTRRFWLVAALCAMWFAPLRAADTSGKWTASFDTQIGKQNYTYDFKVAGTALTGRAKSDNGDVEIRERSSPPTRSSSPAMWPVSPTKS